VKLLCWEYMDSPCNKSIFKSKRWMSGCTTAQQNSIIMDCKLQKDTLRCYITDRICSSWARLQTIIIDSLLEVVQVVYKEERTRTQDMVMKD
jgi:hypothetical protein